MKQVMISGVRRSLVAGIVILAGLGVSAQASELRTGPNVSEMTAGIVEQGQQALSRLIEEQKHQQAWQACEVARSLGFIDDGRCEIRLGTKPNDRRSHNG
ncbi:MAG: hypothetical protein OEZ10_01340 [Gammaproteobacteria bacterium]|nr:hypothetical protein [Gammaproteobacteria bacterium]